MKKLIVFGIIILLFEMSVPSTGINVEKVVKPSLEGKTLYVGGSGPGNYSKIQDAIDDAKFGDTVFVHSGIYYENLKVQNKCIFLIGEDKNNTIIDADGVGTVVMIEKYSSCTVKGFTIRNCEGDYWDNAGIYIKSASDSNIITGNNINNNSNFGIYIDRTYYNLISENIIENNGQYGIFLDVSFFNTIHYNYVAENKKGGIFVGSSQIPNKNIEPTSYEFYNEISGNIITHNYKSGIHLFSTCNTDVFNNNISSNSKGVFIEAAMHVSTWNNDIHENNIMNNEFGVESSEGLWGIVKNNTFCNNNFIGNKCNVRNSGENQWNGNYWDDWIGLKFKILRFLPYIIKWTFWLDWDWNPAKEPYDIGM